MGVEGGRENSVENRSRVTLVAMRVSGKARDHNKQQDVEQKA